MRADAIANKKKRIGLMNKNKYGTTMQIVDYINANNISVKFVEHDRIIKGVRYQSFKNKELVSPLDKTVFGVGSLGFNREHGKTRKDWIYNYWHAMLDRCYNPKSLERMPNYVGCKVCDEWLVFTNFKKWCIENYYKVGDEVMNLDKDILVKNNKIYSQETCCFVPKRINILFIKRKRGRGDLPIGVSVPKYPKNHYVATCSGLDSKQIYIGKFKSINEAFNAYKKCKESLVKQLADLYRDKIPKHLYEALYKYEVLIDD